MLIRVIEQPPERCPQDRGRLYMTALKLAVCQRKFRLSVVVVSMADGLQSRKTWLTRLSDCVAK